MGDSCQCHSLHCSGHRECESSLGAVRRQNIGSVGLPDQGSHCIGSNALIGTGSHSYFTCFTRDNSCLYQTQAESFSVAGSQPQAQGQLALPPAPSHKLMALHPASRLLVEEAALEVLLALPSPGSHPVFPTHLLLGVLKWNHKHHIPSLQLQLVTVSGCVIMHGLDLWREESLGEPSLLSPSSVTGDKAFHCIDSLDDSGWKAPLQAI